MCICGQWFFAVLYDRSCFRPRATHVTTSPVSQHVERVVIGAPCEVGGTLCGGDSVMLREEGDAAKFGPHAACCWASFVEMMITYLLLSLYAKRESA